jgi:HK97 family phage portal protein
VASFWQRITSSSRENRAVTPSIPPRSSSVATAESALSLTAVWRSVQILATSVSNLGIVTKKFATGMEMNIDNSSFINKPSFSYNRQQFLYATVSELALTGNAFWVKSANAAGLVQEATLIPSSQVNVYLTNENDLTSPRFYVIGDTKYQASQIEHLQLFPRAGWLKAPSPINICSADIVAALDLRDFQANWFSASGVPTGILTRGMMEVNAADANEIRTRWQEMQTTRQLAVIGNGYSYENIADSPADMMFTEISKQSVQQIARLFGIPARKLVTGVDGTSDTYSNLTDEEHAFYRETLMAYTRPIQDALSNCLPRGTRVEFLWEDLFQADKASRINMWKTAIDAGIVTAEFAATKEGFQA